MQARTSNKIQWRKQPGNQSASERSQPAYANRGKHGGSHLRPLIKKVVNQLLRAELLPWFTGGPTDAAARRAAKWAAGKNFQDWSNVAGSALVLAMLQPDVFDIWYAPSLSQAFDSDREWWLESLTFISPSKQRSSRGINNRRTNILEGLLNHFAELSAYSGLHNNLHRAWQLMSRALWLVDPELELAHTEQVKRCLSVNKPINDDDWWRDTVQCLTDQAAECARKLALEEALETKDSSSPVQSSVLEKQTSAGESAKIDEPPLVKDENHKYETERDSARVDREDVVLVKKPLLDLADLPLSGVIAYANLLFVSAKLPQWFLADPSSASAKLAAQGDDVFNDVPGWTHSSASAVILAMLEPAKYGIPAPSLFLPLDAADRDWYLENYTGISSSKKSGHNSSRTLLLKGLLSFFSGDRSYQELAAALRRSLELMIRCIMIIDPCNELDHRQQVQQALICTDAIEDDNAWSTISKELEQKTKQEWRVEAELWGKQECDRLFAIMLPQLRSFAEEHQPGSPVTRLTYSLMRSWLPGEGFSSKKKGPSAMLKRLWVKAENQLIEWGALV